MKIICIRTGKTLEKDLTITTASESMERRIRQCCESGKWTPENTEGLVATFHRCGWNPFMFDVFAN